MVQKPIFKPKVHVKTQAEIQAEEMAAMKAKIEEEEQDKTLAKMQSMLKNFDDSEKEKESQVNKDYFRRNERKQPNSISLTAAIQPEEASADKRLEQKAKSTILKGLLGTFQF